MFVLVDRVIIELDTQSVAAYALMMRHHFDGVLDSFDKYGPVRIKGPSPEDALRIAQMLNRQLICREGLKKEGVQVYARGSYLVVVSSRAQLEWGTLYTLDKERNFRVAASEQMH